MKKTNPFCMNVLSSVIASVVVILFHRPVFSFLSALWNWLVNMLINSITLLSDNIANEFYTICSQRYSRSDAVVLSIFFGIVVLLAYYALIKSMNWTLDYLVKRTRKTENSHAKIIVDYKKQFTRINQIAALITFLALTIFFFASGKVSDSFNSSLAVLSPHLSEQEEEELLASWVLMESSSDFDAIRLKIENYAEQYDVTLPSNLFQKTQKRESKEE